MAYQIPESRYKWQGDQLTAQRATYKRPTRSAPFGPFSGGGWSHGDAEVIGSRGDDGFNFLGTPQSADVKAAGAGRAYSVGGQATPQLTMQRFMDSYTEATQKAELANEERYQQMMGLAAGLGKEVSARGRQDLVSRGLLGTSALIGTETAGSDEAIRAQLGIIERREDVYPDAGMYHGLASQYGEWGGAGGSPSGGGMQIGAGFSGPLQTYAQPGQAPTTTPRRSAYRLPSVKRPSPTSPKRKPYRRPSRATIPTPQSAAAKKKADMERKYPYVRAGIGGTTWERVDGIWRKVTNEV